MTKPRPPLQPLPPVAAGQVHAPLNRDRTPPYKIAGLIVALVTIAGMTLTWLQFRGAFETKAQLSGLAMVTALTRGWGNLPTPTGKIVWAAVGPENVL